MQRLRRVQPDTVIETPNGELAVVSREAMRDAMMDAESMLDFAGGVIEVLVGRAPTGVPGEAVTTGAVIRWKHRIDGDTKQPLPEREVDVLEPDEPEPVEALQREMNDLREERLEEAEEALSEARAAHVEEDGLDRAKLPDEDDSSIPAGAR